MFLLIFQSKNNFWVSPRLIFQADNDTITIYYIRGYDTRNRRGSAGRYKILNFYIIFVPNSNMHDLAKTYIVRKKYRIFLCIILQFSK